MSFLESVPEELRSRITRITSVLPNSAQIFQDLYEFAQSQEEQDKGGVKKRKLGNDGDRGDGKLKSRKSDNNNNNNSNDNEELTGPHSIDESSVIFKLENVSVLSPLRKKLNLVLHLSKLNKKPLLSLTQKDLKTELNILDLTKNIRMATFLPVPEKNNLIYLYINYHANTTVEAKYSDPILLTLHKDTVLQQFHANGILDTAVTDFSKCIEYMRKQAILTGFRISDPFNSKAIAAENDSPSFFVNCHRGTKEGSLYFLPDNILFGFRKPILLFDSLNIESITYSSITRLTFNVTLITKENEKFEFSMIDQSEYAKIDDYVKRKQVKDKSMSEELKAKSKTKNQDSSDSHSISALQEATQEMNEKIKTGNINDLPMHSDDDEENDENFEAESDLSDGSDVDSEEEDDDDDDEDNDTNDSGQTEEDNEEVDVQPREIDEDEEVEMNSNNDVEIISKPKFEIPNDSLNIPIEIDEEDEDEEGSGVEYD